MFEQGKAWWVWAGWFHNWCEEDETDANNIMWWTLKKPEQRRKKKKTFKFYLQVYLGVFFQN